MLYHSTRNPSLTASSAQAVLEGLAPDGGLYIPSRLPAFDWKACLAGDSQAMATAKTASASNAAAHRARCLKVLDKKGAVLSGGVPPAMRDYGAKPYLL